MALALPSQLQVLASLKTSLSTGEYSDLTVVCAGDTHRVHKVIVCGRAKFFARALQFGGQETQTAKVDLSEDEPEIVTLLIQYLYGGEYDPALPHTSTQVDTPAPTPAQRGKSAKWQKQSSPFPHSCNSGYCNTQICPHHNCNRDCGYSCYQYICEACTIPSLEGPASQILTHSKMYEMADRYEVAGLKDLAKEKFSRSCKEFWNTPEFPIAVHHAFSTTPDDDNGLRGLVTQTIATHTDLMQKPELRALLMQFNGLALGILDAKSEELGWATIETVRNG